jgi:hypothetical protein
MLRAPLKYLITKWIFNSLIVARGLPGLPFLFWRPRCRRPCRSAYILCSRKYIVEQSLDRTWNHVSAGMYSF